MKIKKKILYIISGLIFFALAGLITLQMYFLENAYEQKEQAFKSNVLAAMNKVSIKLETNEAAKNFIETAAGDSTVNISPKKNQKNKTSKLTAANYGKKKPAGTKAFGITTYNNGTIGVAISINDSARKNHFAFSSFRDSASKAKTIQTITYSGGNKTDARFSVDSNFFYQFQINNNSDKKNITDKIRKDKARIVTMVVDKLFVADSKPIEKRVSLKETDSLLVKSFGEAGISIPFSTGIITGTNDSLAALLNKADSSALKKSVLRTRLFPSDLIEPGNYLAVYFPQKEILLIKQILPIIILSAVFILIIGGCFFYTLLIIVGQKRFASNVIDFINNMTHEFKTPISTISLSSEAIETIAGKHEDDKLLKYNSIIKEENGRMRMQVEKILQMAVLEEKDYELDLKPIDVHLLIQNAAHSYSVRIDKSGGKFTENLTASNYIIRGDVVHISNIINNILDNAVKYSGALPDISIATGNKNEFIEISVTDKGFGIKEEDVKKVFDKYYRVSTGNNHDIKGFGLGLSYVKLMTEAHKGTIEIKSKYGSGTTVSILLPVKKVTD